MNRKATTLFVLSVLVLMTNNSCTDKKEIATDFLNIDAAYFGQKPPGLIPEIFAPDFISTSANVEFSGTFSPDGTEFYFTRRVPNRYNQLLYSKYEDGEWKAPMPPSFALPFGDFEPSMTSDGTRLYFASVRPLPGDTIYKTRPEIWFVEREDTAWGEPQHFTENAYFFSFTHDDVMYHYYNVLDPRKGFICRREKQDSTYGEMENLGEKYPFFIDAHHPCIAKDESYLIFDTEAFEDGLGGLDLYVSFKGQDSIWTEPKNLGININTEYFDMAPFLSPDGKYLFYSSWGGDTCDIKWVSTKILENLK